MADILPIKGWRYSDSLAFEIENLTAPLFDVVSSKQRKILYENPLNSIHLSVPSEESPAQTAAVKLAKWKTEGVLTQDVLPGIYVYYQYFKLQGEQIERCRKGFIIQVKAYDWNEKMILRHENTLISAVNDRIDLLKHAEIQASPTHGLYEDADKQLEVYMDAAIESPLYELEDYQGVREVVAVIHDAVVISRFIAVLKGRQIILADGHHRLEAAIEYRRAMKDKFQADRWKAHDYHMMYLTNISGNHLTILPTHRIFYGLNISDQEFLIRLEEWFEVKPFGDPEELGIYAFRKPWSFGLILGEKAYLLKLSQANFEKFNQDLPFPVRNLNLVVLHELVFTRILGMDTENQRKSTQLVYERNFPRCLHEVDSGQASFAIITQEIELSQVMEVCRSGYVMPQKSTYFYPKILGGLVFASTNQKEFEFDYQAYVR